jgi:uncharacterized protein YjbI with pentapeptide repeats
VPTARELRERWTPERAADAKEALAKWRRKPIERVAFGVHEGRLDLRGLAIHTNIAGVSSHHVEVEDVSRDYSFVTLDEPPEFQKVTWKSIDLSHAEIDHIRMFLCDLKDCRFVGATMRDWRNWGTHFKDCDFSGAELHISNGNRYRGQHTKYTNCLWRQGRLEELRLSGGRYRGCRFEDVHLVDEQVSGARFARCSFSGRLEDIRFDGRDHDSQRPWAVRSDAMVDCDFSDCSLDGVRFMGIDTRNVGLPAKGQRIPHFSRLARGAYQWVATADLDPNEERFLEMYWQGYVTKLPDDAEGWLDLDFFEGSGKALLERSIAAAL